MCALHSAPPSACGESSQRPSSSSPFQAIGCHGWTEREVKKREGRGGKWRERGGCLQCYNSLENKKKDSVSDEKKCIKRDVSN